MVQGKCVCLCIDAISVTDALACSRNAGNPDLLNIDGVVDNVLTRSWTVFVAYNPLLCACAMVDPQPRSTCPFRKTQSVFSYISKNVGLCAIAEECLKLIGHLVRSV